jgi:hypothetical protein
MASVIASGWENCRHTDCLTGTVGTWSVLSQIMGKITAPTSALKDRKDGACNQKQAKNNTDDLQMRSFLAMLPLNMGLKTQNATLRSVSC